MDLKEIIKQVTPPFIMSSYKKARHKNLLSSKELLYEYQKCIQQREGLALTDVEKLSEDIPACYLSSISTNIDEPNFYGGYQVLRDYAGLNHLLLPPRNITIQHGYVFEILSWEKEKLEKINFVWSKAVLDMFKQYSSNDNIFSIGAPFFYANSILDKDTIISEKKRLGKNLLAFPMHSSHNVDTNYDPHTFINILKEERKHFDTVRVCLYWKDLLRGEADIYLKSGFECVSCGHIFDVNFLKRQKALFEICDASISNGVGSHIGYSIFMKKPHKLIDDIYSFVDKQGHDGAELAEVHRKKNFLSVKKAFLDNQDYIITPEQIKCVDKFWGISEIKTPSEIRDLLLKFL